MAIIILHWVLCLIGAFVCWFLVEVGSSWYGSSVEYEEPLWYLILNWISLNVPVLFYVVVFGILALIWDDYINLKLLLAYMPEFRLL